MMLVMMGHWVAVLRNDVAGRINLHHHAAPILLPQGEKSRCVRVDTIVGEVSVLEYLCMASWTVRPIPAMDFCTVIINEFDGAGAREMR